MKKNVTGFVSFIGIDLHNCTVTLRAVSADGESLEQLKCDTKCGERIAEWIKALPGPKWLAVEACPFCEWFIDRYTPCVDLKESAGRTPSGNITKAGSTILRWALCQAAVTLFQSDVKQEATRQRFIARMPKAKANVVMGRRLLRMLYAMVRDQKPYQGGERRDGTKAANQAKTKRRALALQPA